MPHLPINFGNQLLIITISCKRLFEGEQVFTTIVAFKCLCDRLMAAPDSAITEPGKHQRVTLAGKYGIEYSLTTLPGDVAEDSMDLQVHLVECLLHMQDIRSDPE
jgi:hypothetical protein